MFDIMYMLSDCLANV